MDLFPLDPATLAAAREEAVAARDDRRLLAIRQLERALLELPAQIGGVRRIRLLCADALATTWEGWDAARATRVLIRTARPEWRRDPVMLRRLAEDLRCPDPPVWSPEPWPHLRVDAPGPLLLDRLPAEDPPDPTFQARVLAAGLSGLARLHGIGLSHGGPMAAHLTEGREGVQLLWLGNFAPRSAHADLADLAATVAALYPLELEPSDPVGQLAQDWAQTPPPSAEDGLRLLRRAMRGALLDQRHRLALAARRHRRLDRVARLAELTAQLETALPPPAVTAALRVDPSGVMMGVACDGLVLRGGAAGGVPFDDLPVVYSPSRGLEPSLARALLRAWARRASGDEAARAAAQRRLGAEDGQTARLMRWLSAMARLRAARLLLAAMRPEPATPDPG